MRRLSVELGAQFLMMLGARVSLVIMGCRVAFFVYLSRTAKNSKKPVSQKNANKTIEIQTLFTTSTYYIHTSP